MTVATPAASVPEMSIVYRPGIAVRRENDGSDLLRDFFDGISRRIAGDLISRIAASRIDETAILASGRWIARMYSNARLDGLRWINPLITSNDEGEMVFEWWTKDRKLTVRIGQEGTEAVKRWGHRPNNEREEVTVSSDVECRKVWRWLAGNES